MALVPAGAAFVLDIDLARLRNTPTGAKLAKLGLTRLPKAVSSGAFQPLRDVDHVVVAVPGGARRAPDRPTTAFEPDAVAVLASGRFTGEAVAAAAVQHIRARGGDPVRTTLGTFQSVRDLRAEGEIAARDGLFVLSDGAYLRAVLAAAEGHRPDGSENDRLRDRVHAELRRSFGGTAPIRATLTLPEGSLEAALGDPDVRHSPLALVRSAALRVTVTEAIVVDALLVCASVDDCTRVAAFLREMSADLGQVLGPGALDDVGELGKQNEQRIALSFSLRLEDVERYLAPAVRGPRPEPSGAASAPSASAP